MITPPGPHFVRILQVNQLSYKVEGALDAIHAGAVSTSAVTPAGPPTQHPVVAASIVPAPPASRNPQADTSAAVPVTRRERVVDEATG